MSVLPAGYVVCEACGKHAFRRGAMQRYCAECSQTRDLDRKGIEAATTPQDAEKRRSAAALRRDTRRAEGAARSQAASAAWMADLEPSLAWIVRVSVPFDYAMSKNAVWRSVGAGHLVLRAEAKTIRAALTAELALAMRGRKAVTNRVWLDVMVEKPDHRGDAINVLDLVADAVKDAIGVDDRWYSVRRLDWRVVKDSPRLWVGVGQEDGVECQVCSYCGRVLPLTGFGKNRAAASGHARVCFECSRAYDRIRKQKADR